MAKQEKTPKEASNIFHNIMKASVTPPKKVESDEEIIKAVKIKFDTKIVRNADGDGFEIISKQVDEPNHELNRLISVFVDSITKK
jgi:hypothetical protein